MNVETLEDVLAIGVLVVLLLCLIGVGTIVSALIDRP